MQTCEMPRQRGEGHPQERCDERQGGEKRSMAIRMSLYLGTFALVALWSGTVSRSGFTGVIMVEKTALEAGGTTTRTQWIQQRVNETLRELAELEEDIDEDQAQNKRIAEHALEVSMHPAGLKNLALSSMQISNGEKEGIGKIRGSVASLEKFMLSGEGMASSSSSSSSPSSSSSSSSSWSMRTSEESATVRQREREREEWRSMEKTLGAVMSAIKHDEREHVVAREDRRQGESGGFEEGKTTKQEHAVAGEMVLMAKQEERTVNLNTLRLHLKHPHLRALQARLRRTMLKTPRLRLSHRALMRRRTILTKRLQHISEPSKRARKTT
eukprot:2219229-Rhodomonas_salina.2